MSLLDQIDIKKVDLKKIDSDIPEDKEEFRISSIIVGYEITTRRHDYTLKGVKQHNYHTTISDLMKIRRDCFPPPPPITEYIRNTDFYKALKTHFGIKNYLESLLHITTPRQNEKPKKDC